MDGLIVDGAFIGGRACNHKFGSRSPEKVRQMFPHKTIEPHYDEGKHCYWLALGKRGEAKAARLGLTHNAGVTGAELAERPVERIVGGRVQ